MGRKKADTSEEEILSEIGRVEKEIIKTYGQGVLITAQSVLDEPIMVIPMSPSLDPVLGGGIPEGTWFVFTGKPKFGKTTSLLHFCAKAQREEYGSREIYYDDVEGRLKKMNLTGIKGLNLEKFHIIRSKKGQILSGEEHLDIVLQVLENHPGAIVVIDSVSALCGQTEMGKAVSEATMGGTSQAQSRFVRKAANILPVNKNIIIAITHRTASLSMFGSPEREKTSNALAYQADIKLWAKKIDPWIVGKRQIGQMVTWKVEVSALGPPGGEAVSYLRYGHGIDEDIERLVMATDLGVFQKTEKGQYYNFQCLGEEKKIQGLENLQEFLREDPARLNDIQKQINEMLS